MPAARTNSTGSEAAGSCYAHDMMPKPTLISVTTLLLLTLTGACQRKSEESKVEPAATSTPKTDTKAYTMPGLNHGLLQSPINILSGEAEGGHHEIAVNFHHASPKYLENKGHTIELDFPQGSSITFDGKEYQLKQLHFHTPSEHQIDGITFPMEMHVVNMMEPKTPEDPPHYLVLSFLYRMGDEDPYIKSFLDQVPSEVGREEIAPGKVYFADFERDLDYEYFHYRGSLTTPPYTETVEWLIVKQIHEASPEQIRRINLIEGDNARRVQALYGREIED